MRKHRVTIAVLACSGIVGCGDAAVDHRQAGIHLGEEDWADDAVVVLLSDGEPHCTGSVIAPRVVLTAAHCLLGLSPLQVAVGHDPAAPRDVIEVAWAQPHPDFDHETSDHDAALILTGRALDVAPVPL